MTDPSAFTVAPTGEDEMSEYPENELEQAAWDRASATPTGDRLNNLTEAMVEDILKAPAEEILLEELSSRFEKLRAEVSRLSAALATAERDAGEIVADAEARTADIQRDRDKWKSTADAAERERDEARAALGFYALEANWQSETLHEPDPETGEGGEWAQPPALEDQGDIARRSLAKLTEKTT